MTLATLSAENPAVLDDASRRIGLELLRPVMRFCKTGDHWIKAADVAQTYTARVGIGKFEPRYVCKSCVSRRMEFEG